MPAIKPFNTEMRDVLGVHIRAGMKVAWPAKLGSAINVGEVLGVGAGSITVRGTRYSKRPARVIARQVVLRIPGPVVVVG